MSDRVVLVTGGAGYVGSHACKALAGAGYLPVTYDNLSTGHRDLVRWGPLEEGDILDGDRLDEVIERHGPRAVVHFAALSEVAESVRHPDRYRRNNVEGSQSVLSAMVRHRIARIVFSSTAAVYGLPASVPIPEDAPRRPINPYGETKTAIEDALVDAGRDHGVGWMALRYFNAAGADPDGEAGEHHEPESHLIPLVLDTALGRRDTISVYGTDYPTPDGSCLRDFVHVTDLAAAHVLALERLEDGGSSLAVNLGSGQGASVLEIIETARQVTGATIASVIGDRRPGDPPSLVCSPQRARRELGWSTTFDLEAQISHAWAWHRRRFGGTV
ncbi:MAG: UDP-glucose 4-epimerase GalE [Pseudomonadota bacterium]